MTALKTTLLSLLLLFTAIAGAQSVDELRSQLQAARTDTARARISGALAWELKFTSSKEASKLADEEIKYAGNDTMLLTDAYRTKALVCVIENKLPQGLELYEQALTFARRAGSHYYEASCLSLIAGMYQDMGDYDRSLQYYFDGLKVAESGKNQRMIGTLCNNIATIYSSAGRESQLSLRYYKRALKEAAEMKSYAFAELITANMASEYMLISKKDSAEIMIKASMDFARLSGKRAYEYASSISDIGDIYGQLGKPKEAEAYLLESIAVMDSIKRPINVFSPMSSLCRLYIQEGKIAEAEQLGKRLLKEALQYRSKPFIRDGYKVMSDVAHRRGQDAQALKYYEQYNAWDDSVSNDVKQQSIANVQSRAELAQKELEVQYETGKKTQENQILKLQNSNLRSQVLGAAVAFFLLLVLAFFLLRLIRARHRVNRELTEKNKLIEQQSKEKDTLMLEIHHRVKNNLQIVSSLLNLQANSMTDEKAITALRESQNRVKSIALIHQKLYAREELSAILLEEYINELSAHLKSVFSADQVTIQTAVHPPHLKLDMDTSIPLSVILNELITNSIKYARINRAGGHIRIEITDNLDGTCTLHFADNGIGMPDDFDFKTATTLGMRIVYELARQMRATLTSAKGEGASFTIIFPLGQKKN
jgi:two-component sensor histidine kinase